MLVVGCWLLVVGWNPTVKAVGTVAGCWLMVDGCWLLVVGCGFWVRMLIEDLAVYLSKIPKTNNRKPTTENQQPKTNNHPILLLLSLHIEL